MTREFNPEINNTMKNCIEILIYRHLYECYVSNKEAILRSVIEKLVHYTMEYYPGKKNDEVSTKIYDHVNLYYKMTVDTVIKEQMEFGYITEKNSKFLLTAQAINMIINDKKRNNIPFLVNSSSDIRMLSMNEYFNCEINNLVSATSVVSNETQKKINNIYSQMISIMAILIAAFSVIGFNFTAIKSTVEKGNSLNMWEYITAIGVINLGIIAVLYFLFYLVSKLTDNNPKFFDRGVALVALFGLIIIVVISFSMSFR